MYQVQSVHAHSTLAGQQYLPEKQHPRVLP